jgi:hypothetical protein
MSYLKRIALDKRAYCHRKVFRLASELSVNGAEALGLITSLWCWAVDNCEDGCITGIAMADISGVVGWDGEPAKLIGALKASGFVDADGCIHDWMEYTGGDIARVARARDRTELRRKKNKEQLECWRKTIKGKSKRTAASRVT